MEKKLKIKIRRLPRIYHVATGIVWDEKGRCLMAKRPENKIMSGYYEFPGGKLEPGETSFQAMVREMREEFSINVTGARYWRRLKHVGKDYIVFIDFFHIEEYTGLLRANEGQEWLFVLPEEALLLNLLPANLPLMEDLRHVDEKRRVG